MAEENNANGVLRGAPPHVRPAPWPDSWPDLAGRMEDGPEGRRHVLAVRVYFEDTDFSGLVYHGSYVRFCERGRSDMLRLLGSDHRRLIAPGAGDEPAAFVVRRMDFDFRRPARIDEVLEVVTCVAEVGGASITLSQSVHRGADTLVKAQVTVVLVSQSGKPMRIPEAVRSAFAAARRAVGQKLEVGQKT
jgi:acyl-CoA thioester hydrolase